MRNKTAHRPGELRVRTGLSLLLTLGSVCTSVDVQAQPPLAAAQPADAAKEQAIQQRAAAALASFDDGAFREAITQWRGLQAELPESRAYKLDYNLGLAHQALAEVTRAHQHFSRFLVQAKKYGDATASASVQRSEDARARVASIERDYGMLRVPLDADAGARVVVDGGAERDASFTLFLPPGPHELRATYADGTKHQQVLFLRAGEQTSVVLPMPPPAPAVLPPPGPSSPPPTPLLPTPATLPAGGDAGATSAGPAPFPWAWLLGGAAVTGASFALPGVLWSITQDKRMAAQQLGRDHRDYGSARNDFESWRQGYRGSYALPAVLAAVTTTIVVVEVTKQDSEGGRSKKRLGAGVGAARGGAALQLWGQF